MDLNRFDLNLLLSFDVLMKERNVTRAAKRLYISQSAMSHNLRKLRNMIGDPLLVPTSGGMKPTPRSIELEGPIRESLMSIQWNLNPPSEFEPKSSDHKFVLGATDYAEYVILPPLIRRFSQVAPGVKIKLSHFDHINLEEELEKGSIDAAIQGAKQGFSNSVRQVPLLRDTSVVLLRNDHPLIGEELSLADYIQTPHLRIDSMQVLDAIKQQLGPLSEALRINLQSPNFLSTPFILAESNMIATLPRFIAEKFTYDGRLRILPLPFDLGNTELHLYWHRLLDAEPAQQWFREQVQSVTTELDGKTRL